MGVVNFGYNELTRDFNDTEDLKLTNFGDSWATFNVADTLDQGSPHSVSTYGSTVSVPPHGDREIHVRLSVPVATAGGPSFAGRRRASATSPESSSSRRSPGATTA